jgi:(p)ppGpp synthase/HD superfamily hydrolase
MNDFELARTIALKFHAGQMYGKEPYIYHLDLVANSLKTEPDDRLPVIGILHDILEDTNCPESLLRQLFEDNVINAVVALSKIDGEPYESYIDRVKANPLALKAKMHDTLCNMTESLKRGDMKRVRKYSKQMNILAE